jgi:DNA-binding response OmpR family regulator
LRTPLNSIIGFSEVLYDGLAGQLNENQREFLDNILSSGQHLLALINDVLDLSKIHAGRLDLSLEPVPAREVIDGACAVIGSLVDKKGQRLVLDLAPGLPQVFADPFRLKQVFINLLSNAHKFSPQGSVITLAAQPDGRDVCFSVIDQGAGIKPEEGDSIFQEFMQAESGLTRPHEGTGLGLPITRRLVEMHGGRIWFESEGIPGKGAAFYFTIPRAAPCEAPSDMPDTATAAAGARRPALIIDDDRQFSNLLALYLSQQGYQPVQGVDGQSILEVVREVRPALISLDLMLPGRDGWSVLRDLKSAPDTRGIPVLIISALDYSTAGRDRQAVEYLRKPLNLDALAAALRRLGPAPRRVLIVDDDPLGNELVEAMLPPPDYVVTSVVTGPDALDAIRRELPDAILLDLMMPGMSGFDLLELLRADPATRDVPVIVLTAKPLNEREWAHLNAAAQTVIKKTDLTRHTLIEALRRLNLPVQPAVEMREPTP